MDKRIADAEQMIAKINETRAISKPTLWTTTRNDGSVDKVRVYLNGDKGYIDLRSDDAAHVETIGRASFQAAKDALAAAGYKRVFA